MDGAKPKKAVRFVAEPDADPNVLLINHLKAIEGRLDRSSGTTSPLLRRHCCRVRRRLRSRRLYRNHHVQLRRRSRTGILEVHLPLSLNSRGTASEVSPVTNHVHRHLRQPRSRLRRRQSTALLHHIPGLDTPPGLSDLWNLWLSQ